MLFEVSHTTEYTYSGEVFLEPHIFRFKPRNTSHSVLKDFHIKIEPEPTGFSEQNDVEDNHNFFCWFDGSHQHLKIETRSVIENNEYNPFSFLVQPPEFLALPFKYDERNAQLLKPSLNSEGVSGSIIKYVKGIQSQCNNQSVDFLVKLTQDINMRFNLKSRETGKPRYPDFTFDKKEGSCRDLAWMQIQMLRHAGIAARFVSGYFYLNVENPEFELHAWVEAYLPGAGWIGLDPGHGMLTNGFHIPVASSAFYENTMPVTGTVRGDANATLNNELKILCDV